MEEMIRKFVEIGYGNGYDNDNGNGNGYDNDNDNGNGNGYDNDNGNGDGDGSGSGSGYGYGDGSGSGYGYGYGLFGAVLNSHKIHNIDGVATIIYRVYKDCAKGAIVKGDLTLTPCYVVKRGNVFAHGETLRKAAEALNDKLFADMPVEERIKAFCEKFKPKTAYSNKTFYEWHNKLTGSCEMGRTQFAKEHNVDLEALMTVEEFIKLTENAFGGDIIKMLKSYYSILDRKEMI